MATSLSRLKPDFEDIRQQLISKLQTKSTWKSLLATDTGAIIIEYISAVAAFLQDSIQLAHEESFTDTAKLDSSLRALARTLSVRLARKIPARATVTLDRTDTSTELTIPPYSQFSTSGALLFNRDSIVFPAGDSSVDATLYEGEVKTGLFEGDGSEFQQYEILEPDFIVSNLDVNITVNSDTLEVITDGIWHYKNTDTFTHKVVMDTTYPTGELQLVFGNELFGYIPSNGSTITVTYVVTKGYDGNDLAFNNKNISFEDNPDVTGTATSSLTDGSDEVPAEVYRISPQVYAAGGRAVSTDDHNSLVLEYGGIADARFFGQRNIAPNVKEYSMLVYAYILLSDGSVMTQTEFDNDFLPWLLPRAMSYTYLRKVPVAKNIDVVAKVFCKPVADLNVVKSQIQTAVQNLFKPRYGYLGRNMYINDISDAIRKAHPDIDYIQLTSPTTDTIGLVEVPLNVAVVPGIVGGSLTDGVAYQYSVSSVSSEGETFTSPVKEIILSPGQTSVDISWDPVPGAISYRVYGRIQGSLEKLTADIPAGTTTYTDDGSATTGIPENKINTSGLFYANLNLLTLTMAYSDRTTTS